MAVGGKGLGLGSRDPSVSALGCVAGLTAMKNTVRVYLVVSFSSLCCSQPQHVYQVCHTITYFPPTEHLQLDGTSTPLLSANDRGFLLPESLDYLHSKPLIHLFTGAECPSLRFSSQRLGTPKEVHSWGFW